MGARIKNFLMTSDIEDILFYIEYNSNTLFELVNSKIDHDFVFCRKYLTHSDLLTIGKPTKKKKELYSREDFVKSFILYYQDTQTLIGDYDKLPTAAQSNIGIPDEFFDELEIDTYRENNKKQYEILNKYNFKAYIPLDACKDFNLKDFQKIIKHNDKFNYELSELKKLKSYDIEKQILSDDKMLTCQSLHIAAHGIGTKKDKLLSFLRSFAFKGDVFNILFDKTDKIIYLFLERNEEYFNILNEIKQKPITKPIWRNYNKKDKQEIVETLYSAEIINSIENNELQELPQTSLNETRMSELLKKYYREYNKTIEDIVALGEKPKNRWYQRKWKEVLIKLDELSLDEKGYAVCAISRIKGQHNKLGRFFIASHIKPYAKCIEDEDYESCFDPHNGLILSASIDALFDQYLITILPQTGEIVKNNVVDTISNSASIFNKKTHIQNYYLTDRRKEYLLLHNEEFRKKLN